MNTLQRFNWKPLSLH